MVISQYYHQFNKSVLRLTLQSKLFFQPEVDSKHSESEWNQDSDSDSSFFWNNEHFQILTVLKENILTSI